MNRGTLIIFSGLPGSGKSTLSKLLAAKLNATYIRIDTVEQSLRADCGITEVDGKGYRLSYRIAQDNLKIGNSVIADSVNPWELTRREWNAVAEEIGASFVNVEIVCVNQAEHRTRVETRTPHLPGFVMPTWEEIARCDYHPWTESRIQIDTSGKTIDQSFEELMSLISLPR